MGKFFGEYEDSLALQDHSQALRVLAAIDLRVPGRGKGRGRIADHVERFGIVCYLETLLHHGQLPLPCTVQKSERPDFVLSLEAERLGLEMTECIRKEEAHADALMADLSPGGRLLAHDDEDPRAQIIELSKPPPLARAWSRAEAEREWPLQIRAAIWSKTCALNKTGFQLQDSCELLLCEDSDSGTFLALLGPLEMGYVQSELVPVLDRDQWLSAFPHTYRRVHILTQHQLVLDVLGQPRILPVTRR